MPGCTVGSCPYPGRDYLHLDADGQWGVFTYCLVHAIGLPMGRDDEPLQTAPRQSQTEKESESEKD